MGKGNNRMGKDKFLREDFIIPGMNPGLILNNRNG